MPTYLVHPTDLIGKGKKLTKEVISCWPGLSNMCELLWLLIDCKVE